VKHLDNSDVIAAAFAHPLIATIDPDARYAGEYLDGGTWVPMFDGTTICGGHVQIEIAGAALHGGTATADGTTVSIRPTDGVAPTRWTPAT
jgi:hypothetical protein